MSKYQALKEALNGDDSLFSNVRNGDVRALLADLERAEGALEQELPKPSDAVALADLLEERYGNTVPTKQAAAMLRKFALAAITQLPPLPHIEMVLDHPEHHMKWTRPEVKWIQKYATDYALTALAQQAQPVHQFRRRLCADWYDGHPDHEDGGGPYETRILYTTPPAPQAPGRRKGPPGITLEPQGHEPPAVPVVEAFAEGWRMAADWANRDDLLPDMDSPQYAKERDERLAELRPAVEPLVSGWSIDDHRDGSVTIETPEGRIISLHRSGGSGMESTAYSLALLALRPQAVEPMTTEQRDAAIDAKLAEYGYPANTRNAARAGWYACLQALGITAKAEGGA